MLFHKSISFLLLSLLITTSIQAQEKTEQIGGAAYQEKYQHPIRKTSQPIKLDGDLSDAAWQGLEISKNFAPHWPQDNVPLKRDTEVRMTFDDQFLYVAAVCRDSTNKHVIQSLKRDGDYWSSDAFGLILDPINERTNGFFFGVSAANAQFEDLLAFQSDEMTGSWDNKWYSQTKIYATYWTVEIAIPFKTLRYNPTKTKWGVNFERNDLKNNQYSTWTFIPVNFNGYDLGYTGSLIWETTPPAVKGNISLIPYITGGSSHDHTNALPTKGTFNGGLDAKVAITPSLNLDLTVNPDFSQVEVDRQVTNLTRFSIFFPERRTFFLENADLFGNYGIPPFRPFFSRAIGLDRNAQPLPILAGVRLSGNLDKNWRVGLMSMQTAAKGEDPAQNFTAFSFNRKLFKRSLIKGYALNRQGFMTEQERLQNPMGEYGRNQGLEFNYSNVKGDLSLWTGYHWSQKPTITADNSAKQFGAGYFGRTVSFFADYFGVGSNYYADMGFINRLENPTYILDRFGKIRSDTSIRVGFHQMYSETQFNIRPKKGKVNTHAFGAENFFVWNPNGSLNEYTLGLTYDIQFQNTGSLGLRLDHNDVRALFPFSFTDSEYALPGQRYVFNQFSANYDSDYRKKFYFSAAVRMGEFYNGTLQQYTLQMTYRAQPWGNFSLNFEQNDIKLPEKYGSDRLLLVSPRVEINFSTKIFWTTFLQFNTQRNNFNVNSRLQWRYKPMSDFFLVYTDNYYTDPLFRNKNRAIVFKLNYWLTL